MVATYCLVVLFVLASLTFKTPILQRLYLIPVGFLSNTLSCVCVPITCLPQLANDINEKERKAGEITEFHNPVNPIIFTLMEDATRTLPTHTHISHADTPCRCGFGSCRAKEISMWVTGMLHHALYLWHTGRLSGGHSGWICVAWGYRYCVPFR